MLSLNTTKESFAEKASLLTYDKNDEVFDGMPKNFRDLSIFGINAIASGQFSEQQLLKLREKYPNDKIIVVDLRRESHGFVNGKSVQWRSKFEKINDNMSVAQVILDEKLCLNNIQNQQEAVINEVINRDRDNGWYKNITPQIVNVQNVATEKDLAEKYGFKYQRFLVRDFDIPSKNEFEEMINFIKNTPQDHKIYVHCAGGKGRTGMFLTAMDIIKNGKNVELSEIFKRQHQLGSANLKEISVEESWNIDIAKQRVNMLEDLFRQVRQN